MTPYLLPGTYDPVEVASHALDTTSKGSDFLKIRFRDPGTGGEAEGRLYFTDAALPHTERALRALGWDLAANDGDVRRLHGTRELVGRRVQIVVRAETYARPDGTQATINKVAWVNPCGSVAPVAATSDAQRFADLASRLRARAGRGAGPSAPPPAPPSEVL